MTSWLWQGLLSVVCCVCGWDGRIVVDKSRRRLIHGRGVAPKKTNISTLYHGDF